MTAEDRWVFDDVIESGGSAYAHSATEDLKGGWLTQRGWEDNPTVRVRLVQDEKGYQRSAVQVSGCRDVLGASVGVDENGTYLKQPPLDDIAG